MFSAFVTIVRPVEPGVATRSVRVASARATSVIVVPPLSAMTCPGPTRPAAAVPMRCFSSTWRAVL